MIPILVFFTVLLLVDIFLRTRKMWITQGFVKARTRRTEPFTLTSWQVDPSGKWRCFTTVLNPDSSIKNYIDGIEVTV